MVKTSADFLKGVRLCMDNAQTLQFSADALCKQSFHRQAAFMLDTAMEEIAKGLYCVMIHRGWIDETTATDIMQVFNIHAPKYFLARWLPSRLSIKNGLLMVDGISISNISDSEWKQIIAGEKAAARKYMDYRNAKLYVDLDQGVWSHPKGQGVTAADVMKQQTTCSLIMGLLIMLCMNQSISSLDGVSFGVQATTETPVMDISVNGQSAAVVVALLPTNIPTP